MVESGRDGGQGRGYCGHGGGMRECRGWPVASKGGHGPRKGGHTQWWLAVGGRVGEPVRRRWAVGQGDPPIRMSSWGSEEAADCSR